MGNIASGHFKPTNNIQEKHNDRTLSPSYLLPEEFRGQNEVNRSSTQARELKERIIENAKIVYEQTKKKNAPKFKAKSYLWSLVVNIKTNTTMSDLEKLAEHFDLKYGFQCYQIAIHRDEGYIDENNQPHTNHHAHMEFVTLDKENGKNMMRKAHLSSRKFADMQTEIAQILGMDRGKSGTERIEPRKYAQMKEKERKELQAKNNEINSLKQEKVDLINEIIKEAAERNPTNYLNELVERFRVQHFVISRERAIAFSGIEVPVFQDNKMIATRKHHEAVKIPLNDETLEAIKEAKKKEKALLNYEILNDKIDKDASVIISKSPKDLISAFPNNNEETIKLAQVFRFVIKHSLILDWENDTSTLSSNTNSRLKEAFSKVFDLDLETLELNFFKQETTQKGEISVMYLDQPNLKGKLIGTNKEILIPIEQSFLKIEIHRALNQTPQNTGFNAVSTPSKTAENEKKKESQIPPKNANEIVQILLKNALKEIFDTVKKLKELYSKIVGKLFGDENAKKDHQDILNAINELQERPTKEQYSQLEQANSEQAQTIQEKEQELNNLKQNKTTLTNKLQEQATETQKAQERIKTLESNENTLKNDLNAKEKTINELKKQIQDLEYNYTQERERMKAENKRLQEQGLDKIYAQKDYEALKAEHNEQIEALKNKTRPSRKTTHTKDKLKTQETNKPNKKER